MLLLSQMVLDAGQIVSKPRRSADERQLTLCFQVEFGKPAELLQNEKGILRSLVDESGDKGNLYAMAANHESKWDVNLA